MTETEQAQRLTDYTLGMRVLHLTDRLDLTDEALALMEEAAQRLIDSPAESDDAAYRLIDSEAGYDPHTCILPQKDC